MIIYEGIGGYSANELAKELCLRYGQQLLEWDMQEYPGLMYKALTAKERHDLEARIIHILDRLDSEVEHFKIIERYSKAEKRRYRYVERNGRIYRVRNDGKMFVAKLGDKEHENANG